MYIYAAPGTVRHHIKIYMQNLCVIVCMNVSEAVAKRLGPKGCKTLGWFQQKKL